MGKAAWHSSIPVRYHGEDAGSPCNGIFYPYLIAGCYVLYPRQIRSGSKKIKPIRLNILIIQYFNRQDTTGGTKTIIQKIPSTRNFWKILADVFLLLMLIEGVSAGEECTFIGMWGPEGGGSGITSHGVAVDSHENVYMTETGSNRVVRYSLDRSINTWWDLNNPESGYSVTPYGIAVDTAGTVYVTQRENNTVLKLTMRGTEIWGSRGSGDGQFSHPTGIAVDASGNVYVADTGNNRIQKFHSTGLYLMQWGSYGSTDGVFNAPEGVAVDAYGHIYVADTGNQRIQKFSPDGTFLLKWGSGGTGNGQFSVPTGIAADSWGNLFVADHTSRLQKFNPAGEFLGACEIRGNTIDVAIDPSGTMYALWEAGSQWKIGKYRTPSSPPQETPRQSRTLSVIVAPTTLVTINPAVSSPLQDPAAADRPKTSVPGLITTQTIPPATGTVPALTSPNGSYSTVTENSDQEGSAETDIPDGVFDRIFWFFRQLFGM